MPEYRMYFLNDDDRVIDVVHIDCVSDVEALRLVEGKIQHHFIELWRENRFLVRAVRSEAEVTVGDGRA